MERTPEQCAGLLTRAAKTYPIAIYFDYAHLPKHLQEVSAKFADLALEMITYLPLNDETTCGLRKLLEAKDCAVRAALVVASRR